MTVAEDTSTCFQLKGGLFTLPTLRLNTLDYAKLSKALEEKIQQAPNFFRQAPIVLDLHLLGQFEDLIDFTKLADTIKNKGLILVGIRGGTSAMHASAREAGLAILPESRDNPEKASSTPSASTNEEKTSEAKSSELEAATPTVESTDTFRTPTKLITQPVRSGQQVYAPGGDLIVLAPVSHGAELLADGHIHVYGPLRGRALAGINGDKNAIIYCQSLEAELISIAGHYRMSEDFKETMWKLQAMIQLKDDRLSFNPL